MIFRGNCSGVFGVRGEGEGGVVKVGVMSMTT